MAITCAERSDGNHYVAAKWITERGELGLSLLEFALPGDLDKFFYGAWLSSFCSEFKFQKMHDRLIQNMSLGTKYQLESAALSLAMNLRFGSFSGLRPRSASDNSFTPTFPK